MPDTALVPAPGRAVVVVPGPADQLIADWLGRHGARTVREYQRDLSQFGKWCRQPVSAAVDSFLACEMGEANAILTRYQTDMSRQGLSPATINRRVSAIRSIVRLARRFGKVTWSLEVPGIQHQPYRDTKGPPEDQVVTLLEHVSSNANRLMAARDAALVMLMFGQGLRREEVSALNLAHFDSRASRLQIMGKGRREPEWITLAPTTLKALTIWTTRRGREPGPLFAAIDRHGQLQGRLSGDGIHYLTQKWGEALNITLRPHGLRHTFVNVALEQTGGNLHAVRKAARWKKLDTVASYDDNRTDLAGEVARKVSARVADIVDKLDASEKAHA